MIVLLFSTLRILLILFLCTPLLSSAVTQSSEAYENYLKGEYEILLYNFEEAEMYFSKALLLSPHSPTIIKSLIDITSYQGKYSDALEYMEQLFYLEPDNKESSLDLYEMYLQNDNFDAANIILDSLIIYHPDDQDILFAKLNIQYAKKDWNAMLYTYKKIYLSDINQSDILKKIYELGIATEKIPLLKQILWDLKIVSDDEHILQYLIDVEVISTEYDAAITLHHELIDKIGNSDTMIIRLGELYLRNNQFNDVILTLELLDEKNKHSFNVLKLLLVAYSGLNQIQNEIVIGESLIANYPDFPIGYEVLAHSYMEMNKDYNAIEILLKGISNFPKLVIFPYMLATIYYEIGDYHKAENYYFSSLFLQPEMISIQHSLGTMYETMNDRQKADSLYLHLIQNNEYDPVSLNDYAYIISEREESSMEELNYALDLAMRAIAIEPNNSAFLDTIGWIYYKQGTFHKAEEYLKKSLKINHDNPLILEHLADIYINLDKSREAINLYEKILQIDSDNNIIKEKINQVYDK